MLLLLVNFCCRNQLPEAILAKYPLPAVTSVGSPPPTSPPQHLLPEEPRKRPHPEGDSEVNEPPNKVARVASPAPSSSSQTGVTRKRPHPEGDSEVNEPPNKVARVAGVTPNQPEISEKEPSKPVQPVSSLLQLRAASNIHAQYYAVCTFFICSLLHAALQRHPGV